GKATCELLEKKEQEFTLPGCGPWVLSNAGAEGEYRSNYQPQTVQALSKVAATDLTPGERIMLLADLWASMRAGRADISDSLLLAESLRSEKNRAVVQSLLAQINYAGLYLVSDSDRPIYQHWVRGLLAPLSKALGFEPQAGDDDDRKNLRATVLH